MLTRLIEEARAQRDAAQDEAYKKFNEYMTAPMDSEENEKKRHVAMELAEYAYHKAQGVMEGLIRAQEYLNTTARASA